MLGTTFSLQVDNTISGHPHCWIAGYQEPYFYQLTGGQCLLVNAGHNQGEVLQQAPMAGGAVQYDLPIPSHPSLISYEVHIQAAHFGAGMPFELSNAVGTYLGL